MTIHVIELARVAPQPWRNGGGQTRELLAWPQSAPRGEWLLRVSVADIEQDGPFSPFPGVQRCIAMIEGAGVVLTLADGGHRLTRDSMPLAFDGAEAPGCRLIEGPTRDLNLMGRRIAGRIRMWPAAAGDTAPAMARWLGLYTASPAVLGGMGSGPLSLPARSLAWSEAPQASWQLEAAPGAGLRAWWLLLEAHG
jgi:hypothetical protein